MKQAKAAIKAHCSGVVPSAVFPRINPLLTFDNLVSGRANQFACAIAAGVAENPGRAYNPLFVHGAVGMGKTHLLHAIGNQWLTRKPSANIRYVNAEQFVTEVVRAYQNKAFDVLRRNYQKLDILLIDDIHLFAGKSRTQEEFVYLFDALVQSGKQIVIASKLVRTKITNIDDQLASRFSGGLTVSLESPDLEMRVAILFKKAERDKLKLKSEVAFFIAKRIRSDVRELEGGLANVTAYSRFNNVPVTMTSAKAALETRK